MSDDPFGREPRPGFLQRLFRRTAPVRASVVRRTVTSQESLTFVVPEARAAAVRRALESWLGGRGIHAPVSAGPPSDGKVRLAVRLEGDDAQRLDLGDATVQGDLQRLLSDAV